MWIDPAKRGSGATKTFDGEVLIVGGGMVGMTLGCALSGAGVNTILIDRDHPGRLTAEEFDGRSSAIARGSQQMLAGIGVWDGLRQDAQPIFDIRVSDGQIGAAAGALYLHYDHCALDGLPLGYIVENSRIRACLRRYAAPRLTCVAPAELKELTRDRGHVVAKLSDGSRACARLAVGADGRNSHLRQAAGIGVTAWSYPQIALVCTVAHGLPHRGVAHEHFLPSGPFAMLPMTDQEDGTHRSSIVWTERSDLADAMAKLDDAVFSSEILRRFGNSLGWLSVVGKRWSYPVSLLHAERYIDRRLALIGDAAHVIHPIAGQGLNLGLRDVAVLAELIVDAYRLGLDIGEAEHLDRYQSWRRLDNLLLMIVTDSLNRLFSNDVTPLRMARRLGLAAVNRAAPVKRLLMRHAMGLVGDLPRLMRGQRL